MTKHRQRRRRQQRAPRARPPSTPALVAAPEEAEARLGGWTREAVRAAAAALAQDLRHAGRTAKARATGGHPPGAVMGQFLAPLREVYQVMDAISARLRAQPTTALTPACTVGCDACCRLYVEIGPWEAFGIADYLTQVWDAGGVSRDAVLARLRDEVTRYVESGYDTGGRRWCAFLSREGHCGIYPARPTACRSYYSTSRAACERYFAQPHLRGTTHASVVRTLDQGLVVQLAIAESLAAAQPPFPPIDVVPVYEMQSMVLRILETPNALVRYLQGENIFAGCARHTAEAALRAASHNLLQLQVPAKGVTDG